jgi:phthalate 4,5-dioxygenase
MGSTLCQRVRQRSYPVMLRAGVVWAWLGPEGGTPPALPAFDAFSAPDSHVFAFKGLWHCNWLQAFEVGIDPAHPSFLHRYLQDESLEATYGPPVPRRQRRRRRRRALADDARDARVPQPRDPARRGRARADEDHHAAADQRPPDACARHARGLPAHLRDPAVGDDDHHAAARAGGRQHTYWFSFFTSFAEPVDRETMRAQRLAHMTLPDYVPKLGRHNDWGFDPEEQRTRTYLGMGEEDINVHDQWAVESMGAIQDRTREHLGTTDKVIMAHRRALLKAIDAVEAGAAPPMVLAADAAAALTGPDTIDCIAPAQGWQDFWQERAAAKRAGAPWRATETPA